MNKKKIIINILVNIIFIIVLFYIYQKTVLNNLDIFGEKLTGGGIFPYGYRVNALFFKWSVASIVVAFVLWRFKRLNIKLIPLLIIAVILPITMYRLNYNYFINGDGVEYKERQTIVIPLYDAEKNITDSSVSFNNLSLSEYPIFIAEQVNDDFCTYLYTNESFEEMYLFMKLSPDSYAHGNGRILCGLTSYDEIDYDKVITVTINNYGIRDIKIYSNGAVATKDDNSKTYFYSDDLKWLFVE